MCLLVLWHFFRYKNYDHNSGCVHDFRTSGPWFRYYTRTAEIFLPLNICKQNVSLENVFFGENVDRAKVQRIWCELTHGFNIILVHKNP